LLDLQEDPKAAGIHCWRPQHEVHFFMQSMFIQWNLS